MTPQIPMLESYPQDFRMMILFEDWVFAGVIKVSEVNRVALSKMTSALFKREVCAETWKGEVAIYKPRRGVSGRSSPGDTWTLDI